jgi:hypothetical protein
MKKIHYPIPVMEIIAQKESYRPISLIELINEGYVEDKTSNRGFFVKERLIASLAALLFIGGWIYGLMCKSFPWVSIIATLISFFIFIRGSRRMKSYIPKSRFSGKPMDIYKNTDAKHQGYTYDNGVIEMLYVCHESKTYFTWLFSFPHDASG